jgi:hypothetical protein
VARLAFLLLAFLNLVFFVWAAGYLGGADEGREPERLRSQLNPEKLSVIVEPKAAPKARPEPVVLAPPVSPAMVCRRLGPLVAVDAERLAAKLADAGEVKSMPVEGRSYWVFIPAAAARPTDKTAAELRQAGISDFFVVSDDGPNRGAVSLGLYHKEDAANDLLQRLSKKGIKSAKIDSMPRKTDKTILEIRGPAEAIDQALSGLTVDAGECESP